MFGFPHLIAVLMFYHICESFYLTFFQNASKKTSSKSEKEKSSSEVVKLERQFLPEQMPVQRTRKAFPNLLKFMEKQARFISDKIQQFFNLALTLRQNCDTIIWLSSERTG